MRSRDGGSHALERCRAARRWEAKAFAERFVCNWLHPPSLCGLARASPSTAAVYPCCHCDARDHDRADGRDHHASCCRSQAGAPRAPRQPPDADAPGEAGEPFMAIVSIKTQQVTFYDADGWIYRARVSTGTTGRETPAGVFAVLEKNKDHHSSLYDDAWMPNMLR